VGFINQTVKARNLAAPCPTGCSAARGFTLLELLVVLVIVGIMLGFVSFNAMPSERQVLQNEAQRVALLLQLARDEAIVRNQPVAFEADAYRYRFLIRNDQTWQTIEREEMLREREFKRAPVKLSIDPPLFDNSQGLRIVFGREPVDKPFVLTFAIGNSSAAIRADGIGHFVVE
jgi:general secretion pathway protein H